MAGWSTGQALWTWYQLVERRAVPSPSLADVLRREKTLGLRRALEVMFVMPTKEQPNFVVGKATDLAVLVVIGFTLLVSVGLSALVSGFSERLIAPPQRSGPGCPDAAAPPTW